MIVSLRRRHKVIWLIIALALPILFVKAWLDVPVNLLAADQDVYHESVEGKMEISINDERNLITIELIAPIQAINPRLVLLRSADEEIVDLGTLSGRGSYQFEMPGTAVVEKGDVLRIVDAARDRVLDEINMDKYGS